MKKIAAIVASLLIVPLLTVGFVGNNVSAQNLGQGINDARGKGTANELNLTQGGLVGTVVNYLLWFIGILSVIMIIWGGIRYATSAGDSNKVTAAKNTILYAVIGLVIAIFSYAIINWVMSQFGSD